MPWARRLWRNHLASYPLSAARVLGQGAVAKNNDSTVKIDTLLVPQINQNTVESLFSRHSRRLGLPRLPVANWIWAKIGRTCCQSSPLFRSSNCYKGHTIGIGNAVNEYTFAFIAISYTFTATFPRGKKSRQRLRISSRSFLSRLPLPISAAWVSPAFHLRTTSWAIDGQNS